MNPQVLLKFIFSQQGRPIQRGRLPTFVADDKLHIYKIIWLQTDNFALLLPNRENGKRWLMTAPSNSMLLLLEWGRNCIENISSNLFMYLHGGSVSFFLLGKKKSLQSATTQRNLWERSVYHIFTVYQSFYRCIIYAKPWVTSSTVYKIAGTVNDFFFPAWQEGQ